MDLSAAFDLVDHSLLTQKLKAYGLNDDSLEWISTYLNHRYQAVWLDHVLSDFIEVKTGVPQGSNLGPLFFLIFFNDLPEVLDNVMDNYADDSTVTAKGTTVHEIETKLSADCTSVCNWMAENKLKINPEKTKIMTLCTETRQRNLYRPLEVNMNGIFIKEEYNKPELLLGCKIQANLKWDSQVLGLLEKLKSRLAGIRKIQKVAPFDVKKIVTQGRSF